MKLATRCALIVLLSFSTLAFADQWEIVPQPDPRVPFGRLSVVGGATGPDGVRFVVNNLDILSPMQVTLAAADPRKPLQLSIFKDGMAQPLVQSPTDSSGLLTVRFRTADSVRFQVTGEAGAQYQLMTWISPPVQTPTPDAFVAVTSYPAAPPVVTRTAAPAAPSAPVSAATQAAPPASPWSLPVMILLGGILLALIVIIVLLFRGQRKGAAIVLLVLGLGARSTPAQQAQTTPAMIPRNVPPADTWRQTNEALQKLREKLEQLEKAGIKGEPEALKFGGFGGEGSFDPSKTAGSAVTGVKLLLDFMEEFGLIDPREAAVQPNYNPPGQPLLPSRCYHNPQCGACFADAQKKLDKSRQLLEDMYVIYKQTELKTGRILELADAAAGLSPYAKLAWTVQKSNPNEPMNQARQHFYDVYDGDLTKLLAMSNEALIAIGDCERQNFGDYDWYNRYGMVYYNFQRDRYTRK